MFVGAPADFPCMLLGLPLDLRWTFRWFAFGFPLDSHWIFVGYSLDLRWSSSGMPLDRRCIDLGSLLDFSVVFHWIPRLIPVVFLLEFC